MRTPHPTHVVGFFIGLGIAWACIDAGMRAPTPPVACTPTPALAQN